MVIEMLCKHEKKIVCFQIVVKKKFVFGTEEKK